MTAKRYTVTQFAKEVGLSVPRVYQLINGGKLEKKVSFNGRMYLTQEDVEKVLHG